MQENIFPQFKRIKRISVRMVCHKRNPGMKRLYNRKNYYYIGRFLLGKIYYLAIFRGNVTTQHWCQY